jgi:8-oxo-dGTP pyrophosphatase MutT (NUDIX family)
VIPILGQSPTVTEANTSSRSQILRKTYNRGKVRGYVAEIAGTLCVRKGRVLILQRPDGSWDLPKGHVRSDESIRQGAVRETREEIGVEPRLTGDMTSERSKHSTIWIFYATLPDEEIKLSKEHVAYDWAQVSKAQSILYPPLARIVGKMIGKQGQDGISEERAERCGSVAVSLLKPGTKRYERWLAKRNRARKKNQQESAMSFSVTNMRTGETVTSEDMARREEQRREFLSEIDRKRDLRENSKEILFWSEKHRPQQYENCVLNVSEDKVSRVVEALQGGESLSQYKGWATCRICEANLGTSDLGGNGYVWPELAEHYVMDHGVWTPALDKFAADLLKKPASLDEDKTGARADYKHCGVFIPLPYSLAKDFPDKSAHDDSVPHYTLLYVGDLDPKSYKVFCNLVRRFAQKLKPFSCDTAMYSEFLNKEGKKIAHMVPSPRCRIKMGLLHGLLRRFIEQFGKQLGVTVKHEYGRLKAPRLPYEMKFKPHATLDYLLPMVPYRGPKPTGAWRVTELECWGYEKVRIPLGRTKAEQPLGLTRDPLAVKYPMAVPDAVTESTASGNIAAPDMKKWGEAFLREPLSLRMRSGDPFLEGEDRLPGGLADRSKPSDFDPKQLAMGIKVELEHTKDRGLAREIAMDHLKEDPRYYTKLKRVHSEDVIGGSMGAVGKGVGGSSGDIPLDGTLPVLELKKKLERMKLAGLK